MHRTDKQSQHSLIIWSVWLNGWVFIYELSGCWFEPSCSHLRFIFTVFYNYIDNNKNKGLFPCLKDKHEKEGYLGLGNMKTRNALSKLRLSSLKLAIVAEK